MKQLLTSFFVFIIAGMITCAKLPDESLFQPINFKPTIFTPLPNALHVAEGQNITLSVGVKGTEPFKFTWYKNNDSVFVSDYDSFPIKNAQLSHAGSYKVIVTNGFGQDSSKGGLTIDSLFYVLSLSASAGGSPDSFDASRLIADFFVAHPRVAAGG